MEIKNKINELKKSWQKKCLLLNDTYDDFHHGSCATSFVIREKLKKHFKVLDYISIDDIRNITDYPLESDLFKNKEYYHKFSQDNIDIINKMQKADVIVVNGEGCISYYPWNVQLCYLIYIAKHMLNKYVAVINTSIYNIENDFEKYKKWESILSLSLNDVNYLSVRDYKSIVNTSSFLRAPVLSFDCLPVYINEYFSYTPPIISAEYILITGGNNIPQNYEKFIAHIIETNHLNKKLPVYFLVSNVAKAKEHTGDIELYNKIKHLGIQLISASSIDEWLSIIKKATFFISGRFHHSIAAFMLDTPFISFGTDSPKLESVLGMLNSEIRFVSDIHQENFVSYIKYINIKKDICSIKSNIISLAKNNFLFLETKSYKRENFISIKEVSSKYDSNKKHKIICILGIKFKIKK